GACFQIQYRIQRINSEVIAVRFAGRRGGAAVADLAEVVLSLFRSIGERFLGRHPFRQLVRISRQIEEHPMHPWLLARSVGVVADQGITLRVRGGAAPAQRWRNVLAVAGVRLGNRSSFPKSGARELHDKYSLILLRRNLLPVPTARQNG